MLINKPNPSILKLIYKFNVSMVFCTYNTSNQINYSFNLIRVQS